MKFVIDTDKQKIVKMKGLKKEKFDLYSKEAFELLSDIWLKVGWNEQYYSTFSWMGFPMLQLPEDVLRVQEVISSIKPDIIIECGVCNGGSIALYASLLRIFNKRKVIGIDIKIKPEVRKKLEDTPFLELISLIEGDSNSENVINQVKSMIKPEDTVLVILDSNHTKEHVLKELNNYSKFVTKDSYIVATDGVMIDLYDVPDGFECWKNNNPQEAIKEFIKGTKDFAIETPDWLYNSGILNKNITYWPNAWLKRIR